MVRKEAMKSIRQRNLVIDNILDAVCSRNDFLIVGHKNPDEDCISSMIAIALFLNKLSKTCSLLLPVKINENYRYLLSICKYNEISILNDLKVTGGEISTVLMMDTPKPEMQEDFPGKERILQDKSILKIEIDHHLGADSAFCGSPGYCLVDEASSASELVGLLAFKAGHHAGVLGLLNGQNVFTRNFVLAVLTGIIGDSKMGKYLKTSREKWFYRLFSGMFNDMLTSTTRKDSSNLSSMKEVFTELQQLSREEDECFGRMMSMEKDLSPHIGCVAIPVAEARQMHSLYDHDTIVSVARYTADHLAEKSGKLSLVLYYDFREEGDIYQGRIRRNHGYRELDLRDILPALKISNGGGHPGAIGFRISAADVEDLEVLTVDLNRGIEDLMGIKA